MRILITGGCGFVGRHFVKALDNGINEIQIVDNMIRGGGSLLPEVWYFKPSKKVHFLLQDCRSFFANSSIKFDLVIHLAAVVGGRLTIEKNPLAVADDLSIDSSLWQWAVINKPTHIISFSSSAAYPVSLQNEANKSLKESDINFENELGMPDLTYGWAKLTQEYLGKLAAERYSLKVATYRPFSGYGEDQSLDYPFPSICKRAVESNQESEFEVWGSGYQSRDFIHIDDIVDAVLNTYPSMTDGSALNLGSGKLTTFRDLAKMACNAVGFKPIIVGNTNLPEGVFSRVSDNTKLNSTGWKPSIPLEVGVARAVEFFKSQNYKENMR